MASRKFNVLLYALTGEAETLQSGSSGICCDRQVSYSVCFCNV